MPRLLLPLLYVAVGAACTALQGEEPCASDDDCREASHICDYATGFCRHRDEVERPDAAASDAAAAVDAGQADHALPDQALPDVSVPDQALPDRACSEHSCSDILDDDEHDAAEGRCTEQADQVWLADAGICVRCFQDSHCDDHDPCTDDSCTTGYECTYASVAVGTQATCDFCQDALCGVCDGEGHCREPCAEGTPCANGRHCVDAGYCL